MLLDTCKKVNRGKRDTWHLRGSVNLERVTEIYCSQSTLHALPGCVDRRIAHHNLEKPSRSENGMGEAQPARLRVSLIEAKFEKTGKYYATLSVGGDAKRTDVNEEASTSVSWKQGLHSWPLETSSGSGYDLKAMEVAIAITQLLFSKGDKKVAGAAVRLADLKRVPVPGCKPVSHTCQLIADGARGTM